MLSQLPDYIQKEVLHYIQNNNFTEAKAIHDNWLKSQGLPVEFKEVKTRKPKQQQNHQIDHFAEGAVA